MTLYLTVKTEVKDLIIDFIEVQLKSGETVSLNWKRSWVQRGKNGFSTEFEGVCFNEHRATGQLDRLKKMRVKEVGMYSEEHGEGQYSLAIERMEFYDNNKLIVAVLMLAIAKDFILSLPCLLLFGYMALYGAIILYNGLTEKFVAVSGECVKIERTQLRKRVKVIYIQTEKGQMKVPIRKRIGRLNEGDLITIYMPSKTRIYEQDNFLVIFGYYAIDINRQNNRISV